MTEEQQTLLIIKGTISDMTPEHKDKITKQYNLLKQMIQDEPLTLLAITLIGAELAAEQN